MRFDQRQERRFLAIIHGEHAHYAIALEDTKDQRLSRGSPAAFALAVPSSGSWQLSRIAIVWRINRKLTLPVFGLLLKFKCAKN